MPTPDEADRSPGLGDPTRSDDTSIPALRSGGAGRAAEGSVAGPAPGGGDTARPPGAADAIAADTTSADTTPDGATAADTTSGQAEPDAGVPTGRAGHQGGQLGTAGGGYGSAAGIGGSGGGPDGEDVQVTPGPGPQTDWLRGAAGTGPDDGPPNDVEGPR